MVILISISTIIIYLTLKRVNGLRISFNNQSSMTALYILPVVLYIFSTISLFAGRVLFLQPDYINNLIITFSLFLHFLLLNYLRKRVEFDSYIPFFLYIAAIVITINQVVGAVLLLPLGALYTLSIPKTKLFSSYDDVYIRVFYFLSFLILLICKSKMMLDINTISGLLILLISNVKSVEVKNLKLNQYFKYSNLAISLCIVLYSLVVN